MNIQIFDKTRAGDVDDAPGLPADQFKRWLRMMVLTDAAAAKALGVSRATVSNYKRDGAPPSIRAMCRLIYPRQIEAIYPWEREA